MDSGKTYNRDQGLNISLQSEDILIGLGSADRQLLATLIALFEDSKLSKNIKSNAHRLLNGGLNIWERVTNQPVNKSDRKSYLEDYLSVKSKMEYWMDQNKFSDDDLRLILWMYLRYSLQLNPVICLSQRSLKRCATEIVASTIHAYDPQTFSESVKKILKRLSNDQNPDDTKHTLDDIAVPVLNEMIKEVFNGNSKVESDVKDQIIHDIRESLENLQQDDQEKILKSIGAREFNDTAIKNILVTGGGLAAIGGAVNIAGFSAYILAAQASAFIPLVSGPALVSFVSVLSNPVTMIGGTLAAGYWAKNKAENSVRSALAIRVVSMLALQGLSHRDKIGTYTGVMLRSFQRTDLIQEFGELPEKIYSIYVEQWKAVSESMKQSLSDNNNLLSEWMDQSMEELYPYLDLKSDKNVELRKTACVTGLTIGDITYSLAAIDPNVIQAADFSRAADLDGRLSFSEFALDISKMTSSGYLGATSNLKGYVTEHVVASQLILQGHHVELATSSNEAGWDILVDGEKFQIKSLSSSSGISSHFNNYDYPVIVNSELEDNIPEDLEGKVFFVDGFSDELVTDVTEKSLSHGADVFAPDVPLFAIGVSSAFALRDYSSGKIRSDQAMEQVLVDGGTRVGLATLGGFAGTGIGLVVYGPAGALIWGALMPILAQSQTRRITGKVQDTFKTKELLQWKKELQSANRKLLDRLEHSLDEKIKLYRKKYREFESGFLSDYVKRRITDEGRYLQELKTEISKIKRKSRIPEEERSIKILRLTTHSTIHPIKFQKELIEIQQILRNKPSLLESVKRIFGGHYQKIKRR